MKMYQINMPKELECSRVEDKYVEQLIVALVKFGYKVFEYDEAVCFEIPGTEIHEKEGR